MSEALYRVVIDSLRIEAQIGLGAAERARTQPVLLSLDILAPFPKDAGTPEICYHAAARLCEKVLHERAHDSLERLALLLLERLRTHKEIRRIRLRIIKTQAVEKAQGSGIIVTWPMPAKPADDLF